jgi:23S rRNA (pseudouridine1915-N3)-methyltransferase
LILKELQAQNTVVLMDEHGSQYRSIDFADWLQKKQHTPADWYSSSAAPTASRRLVYQRANEKDRSRR